MNTIQNYGISNYKNINKNSNISFTAGTISPELVTQIGQFSVKFAKGNLRNANEYNNFIIGILNKALEKLSPDMVLSSKLYYHNGIKRNTLHIAHKNFPKYSAEASSVFFPAPGHESAGIHYGNIKQSNPILLIRAVISELLKASRQGNNSKQRTDELNKAINQLRTNVHEIFNN